MYVLHTQTHTITTVHFIHPNNLACSVAFLLTIVIDNNTESTHKHMLSNFVFFFLLFRPLFALRTSRA